MAGLSPYLHFPALAAHAAHTLPPRRRCAECTMPKECPRGIRNPIRRGRHFDVFIGIFDGRAIPPPTPLVSTANRCDDDAPYEPPRTQVSEAFGRRFGEVDFWSISLVFSSILRFRPLTREVCIRDRRDDDALNARHQEDTPAAPRTRSDDPEFSTFSLRFGRFWNSPSCATADHARPPRR